MADWIIIADDLTGACDTGVAFVKRGLPTRVAFSPEADFTGARVRVVTTESRALLAEEAARVVDQSARALLLRETDKIYKKIDSTLRGSPGAELAAVMHAAGIKKALVAPAFPGQGRMVRDGRVYVHGIPLAETSFGQEVPEPDLRRLFAIDGAAEVVRLEETRQGAGQVSERIERSSAGVLVADAETDADLQVLVQACRRAGIHLLCGSAGLARALVAELPEEEVNGSSSAAGRVTRNLTGKSGPVLVVSGSYHPLALRQVEAARKNGVRVIGMKNGVMRIVGNEASGYSESTNFEQTGRWDRIAEETLASFLRNEDVILHAGYLERLPGKEAEICESLSIVVTEVLAAASQVDFSAGGLALTGGETAARVCHALSCSAIDLGGEIKPGIAWGWLASGPFAGMKVVTKAGGFGEENTLVEVIRFLR